MEYNFYPNQDSIGNDLTYVPTTGSNECEKYCSNNPRALAYNTLGYVKHAVVEPDQFITVNWSSAPAPEGGHGLYIKKDHDPIQRAKDRIIAARDAVAATSLPLTFTITSCKRLSYFLKAMNCFITRCKDAHLIKEWICVDDNSSAVFRAEMKRQFPWVKFILKTPEEKGHAKSMNAILHAIRTPYMLHYEDDWVVAEPFELATLVEWLRASDHTQLLLRKVGRDAPAAADKIDDIPVFVYTSNFYHPIKPQINKRYDALAAVKPPLPDDDAAPGWWWPGLSLNPSIIKIGDLSTVGLFNEAILPELFEYEYSLRCFHKGLTTAYVCLPINHIGETSSYVLNGEYRSHD